MIAEVCYLLSKQAGHGAEVQPLRAFGTGELRLVELALADVSRMAELMHRYAVLGLGGTDASVVAIAERLGVDRIATFDRRHFRVVRLRHVEAFQLLPA